MVSNLDTEPAEVSLQAPAPQPQTLAPREVPLGGPKGILVRRTLPHRAIRTIGAWCFVDHYGPVDLTAAGARGMVVPPHPHTGLQTVTWLLEGSVEHRDSVGSHQTVRPGELSLMTAGRGISHSEYSLPGAERLFGIQLWVALPEDARRTAPHFEHHGGLPAGQDDGVGVTVFLGALAGLVSPAVTYSPLLGAQVRLTAGAVARLPLDPSFEHGVLVADGAASVDAEPLGFGDLRYLGQGRDGVTVGSDDGATLLLLGGEPLREDLLMWWNFVGRTHEDIAAARQDWEAGRGFGQVVGDDRPRTPAPPLPGVRMMPRGNRP
jgi:redox-sensitive bicupin YhaK (pirin superfamily)